MRPSRRNPESRKGQYGFSLLEVLVSLAILGITLTVILRIFSTASMSTRIALDYYKALQIGESQIAWIAAQKDPPTFDSGTVDDNYRWESKVSEYKPDLNNPLFENTPLLDPEVFYAPYQIDVTVIWGGRKKRQLQLSTIRLGTKY